MIPSPVLAIKALGWMMGVSFSIISNRQATRAYKASDVTASTTGSPGLLLAYRLAMLGWALFIGIKQLLDKGSYVFVFYTVWNWWMLTLFFALASAASIRGWLRRRRAAAGEAEQQCTLDLLDRGAIIAFTIETPALVVIDAMTWLVLVPMLEAGEAPDLPARKYWHGVHHNFESYNMSLAVDSITWAVLVPALLASNKHDPERLQFWMQRMYCFESYNQHGFNAVMMLGDLLLNRIPVTFFSSGYLALFSSAFGVWSGVFYVKKGRFIYPFLDAHKPYAWVSYLGLFLLHWAAYLVVMGLAWAKERLLPRAGTAAEPAAPRAAVERKKQR